MSLAAKGHNSFSLCRPYRALGQSASKLRAKALGYYLSPCQGSGGVVPGIEGERWADEIVSKAIVVIGPDSAPEVPPTFCVPRSCLQVKPSEVLRESRPGYFLPPFGAPEVSRSGLKVGGRADQTVKRSWLSDQIRHQRYLPPSVGHDRACNRAAEFGGVVQ